LLPRSHFHHPIALHPASAALRRPEKPVAFDVPSQPRLLRPRRRWTNSASENRLKNNMM
jgi:hypothetical protein